jgi:hypothetical protein
MQTLNLIFNQKSIQAGYLMKSSHSLCFPPPYRPRLSVAVLEGGAGLALGTFEHSCMLLQVLQKMIELLLVDAGSEERVA